MRIYCQRHRTLLDPQPSGYNPATEWRCPDGTAERITVGHLAAAGIPPYHPNISFVAVVPRGNTTRLIAIPHGAHRG